MRAHHPTLISLGLLCAMLTPDAWSQAAPGKGLHEIPEPELAQMRGRFIVGDNRVAWFGVSIISNWQTHNGQSLHGILKLGFDLSRPNSPKISFAPTVSITAADAPLPTSAHGERSIDSSGLANVSGLVQSIQVAGDGNSARNTTRINLLDGELPAGSANENHGQTASTSSAGMAASASFDGQAARVLLQVEGQGAVEQWIRAGSLGQSISLTGDNQNASNRLQIDLVKQSLPANTHLSQNVTNAIAMTRGIGGGF